MEKRARDSHLERARLEGEAGGRADPENIRRLARSLPRRRLDEKSWEWISLLRYYA